MSASSQLHPPSAHGRGPRASRRRPVGARSLGLLAGVVLLAGCGNANIGRPPEERELFFPSGLLLDPRADEGERAKYLFVVNSNNDLRFNAGTVVAIDLDRFFSKWAIDQESFLVDPYCDPNGRCVLDVGSDVDDELPCRRLALLPQVVECDERPFIPAGAFTRIGDFGTVLTSSCNDPDRAPGEGCERPRLWLPVRGDPSVTFIDILPRDGAMDEPSGDASTSSSSDGSGGESGAVRDTETGDTDGAPAPSVPSDEVAPRLECRQDTDEDKRCGKLNRLTHLRNDTGLVEMDREPFNMLVSPTQPLGYVSHSDGTSLSLIDMIGQPAECCVPSDVACGDAALAECICATNGHDECCEPHSGNGPWTAVPWGLDCIDHAAECNACRPAMVDQSNAFPSVGGALTGGLGLAERPCSTDEDNAPSITLDCARPLVYAAFRYTRLLVSFTVQGVDPTVDEADPEYAKKCAGPDDVDQKNTIVCEPRVRSQNQIFPGGLDPGGASFTPVLGDIAFADDRGDDLLVVQTNPGALLQLDTSIGTDGEATDNPSRPPLELCDQPTRMKLYEEGGQRYALISCYRAALIYVIDLDAFRVIGAVVAGTGPFELEVDVPRRLLYVSNNLENSISVIDLAADRPTRFQEIARIGTQDPFSR